MNNPFHSRDAREALANLSELDNPNFPIDPDSPRRTAESLSVVFDHLDSFGLLTNPSPSRIVNELSEFLELTPQETEPVIEQLKALGPHMPDRYAVSATARQWADGEVEQTDSDTIAGVLYATNRWNVVVPGPHATFPAGCICCGDKRADPVRITSSKTTVTETDYTRGEKTASVVNAYEVCEFCSKHFDEFRTMQLLDKGTPIASGMSFVLGLVTTGLWLLEPSNTMSRSALGWISMVLLTAALAIYLIARKMRSRWSTEASGLKSACRSATCPIRVELDTSPSKWKMQASHQDIVSAPDGIEEKVSTKDIDPSTRLFIWVSESTDMETYARKVSSLNGDAEVVQAVLD